MRLTDGIRKHGFMKWYERELLLGHGWLVLALLAAVVAFAALELLFDGASAFDTLLSAAAFTLSGLATAKLVHRFLAHIVAAQRAATQARCAQCTSFGRLQVVDHGRMWLRVRCRKCGHEWRMDEPDIAGPIRPSDP